MSDAVNILLHCQASKGEAKTSASRCGMEAAVRGSGPGGAGAVWDVWCSGGGTDTLREFVMSHVDEFCHHGQKVDKSKVRRCPDTLGGGRGRAVSSDESYAVDLSGIVVTTFAFHSRHSSPHRPPSSILCRSETSFSTTASC